ncbi:hypothetical protein [Azospirillum palustre]
MASKASCTSSGVLHELLISLPCERQIMELPSTTWRVRINAPAGNCRKGDGRTSFPRRWPEIRWPRPMVGKVGATTLNTRYTTECINGCAGRLAPIFTGHDPRYYRELFWAFGKGRVQPAWDDDEKGRDPITTLGGLQEMIIVNVSGLWSLILTSRQSQSGRVRHSDDELSTISEQGPFLAVDSITVRKAPAHKLRASFIRRPASISACCLFSGFADCTN